MKQMVSFEKVKLTNNELDQHGHVSFISLFRLKKKRINEANSSGFPDKISAVLAKTVLLLGNTRNIQTQTKTFSVFKCSPANKQRIYGDN